MLKICFHWKSTWQSPSNPNKNSWQQNWEMNWAIYTDISTWLLVTSKAENIKESFQIFWHSTFVCTFERGEHLCKGHYRELAFTNTSWHKLVWARPSNAFWFESLPNPVSKFRHGPSSKQYSWYTIASIWGSKAINKMLDPRMHVTSSWGCSCLLQPRPAIPQTLLLSAGPDEKVSLQYFFNLMWFFFKLIVSMRICKSHLTDWWPTDPCHSDAMLLTQITKMIDMQNSNVNKIHPYQTCKLPSN